MALASLKHTGRSRSMNFLRGISDLAEPRQRRKKNASMEISTGNAPRRRLARSSTLGQLFATETHADEVIVRLGKMKKRGGGRKSRAFRERYFILLSSGKLVYFASSECKEFCGCADLSSNTDIVLQTDPRNEFHVITPSRTWIFQTQAPQEAIFWVEAMKSTITNGPFERLTEKNFEYSVTFESRPLGFGAKCQANDFGAQVCDIVAMYLRPKILLGSRIVRVGEMGTEYQSFEDIFRGLMDTPLPFDITFRHNTRELPAVPGRVGWMVTGGETQEPLHNHFCICVSKRIILFFTDSSCNTFRDSCDLWDGFEVIDNRKISVGFQVVTPMKTWEFQCANAGEKVRWLRAIRGSPTPKEISESDDRVLLDDLKEEDENEGEIVTAFAFMDTSVVGELGDLPSEDLLPMEENPETPESLTFS